MGMMAEWRASRERRRRAEAYLAGLMVPPEATDVAWLTAVTGDPAIAVRELTFARRAVGLIVAERDALNDQTAADVIHALAAATDGRGLFSSGVASDWTARWRAYTETLATRGQSDAPMTRLARVLLAGAGVTAPDDAVLQRATEFVVADRARANEALRAVFGVASLPDDIKPSAIRS